MTEAERLEMPADKDCVICVVSSPDGFQLLQGWAYFVY